MQTTDAWDEHAHWWQAEFTDGVDPEYTDQIIPLVCSWMPTAGVIVDVGAGEGQVSREVLSAERSVVCVDPAWQQARTGMQRGMGEHWLVGSVLDLPLARETAHAVVVCLVLEHVEDLDRALDEIARVLRIGGRLVLLLNHPLLQTPNSGWIDDQLIDPPEQYWRIGEYLTEVSTIEQVSKDVWITFFHRPLHRYLNGAISRGLSLEEMVEPAPPQRFLDQAPGYQAAETIPRLLALRFHKVGES